MKKILVVFTGGTIGAKFNNNGILDVDKNAGYALIETFRQKSTLKTEFETIQPLNVLSENLIPCYWEQIYNALIQKNPVRYDGVIITHGTDTLPFTTAAFGYLLRAGAGPVVFIAANYDMDDPKSDGVDNFVSAVEFIASEKRAGVFCVLKDAAGRSKVYLGTRLLSANNVTDGFASYQDLDFGEMENGKFIPLYAFNTAAAADGSGFSKIRISKKVMALKVYPGLDYTLFDFKKDPPAAILHTLYHSSTACVTPEPNSLIAFAKKCEKQNIPLYLLDGRHYLAGRTYASSKMFQNSNARFLTGISFEAAYAKLVIAYNQPFVAPEQYMKENIFFEYV